VREPPIVGPLSESVYDRWWKLARDRALTEAQAASPLVRRPYDLRHAAASLWLNAGVPPTEVARRGLVMRWMISCRIQDIGRGKPSRGLSSSVSTYH
jgi:integrase